MRRLIPTLLFLFALTLTFGQGIEFFKGTWDEAIAEAKKQDKIIFVDAYAVWCGPCKKMAKTVFTHEKVGTFYNENFINVKLDMERGEGLTFRKKYPVSAFPTLFYIDYSGEVVQKVRGAQQVDKFISLGKKALKMIDRSGEYAAEYEKGNRDPELVYNYIRTLNQAGKSSLKVTNEYIRSQKDLSTEQNLRIIMEGATEADSKVFDLLIENRKQIVALEGAEAVDARIYSACEATARKAIEFESKDLLATAKSAMKKHHPARATEFATRMEMDFCLAMGDADHYLESCKTYAKKVAKNDPAELNKLAYEVFTKFKKNKKATQQAENFAAEASKKGNDFNYYILYAQILDHNGKRDEALAAAQKSLQLARKASPSAVKGVERYIERLEG